MWKQNVKQCNQTRTEPRPQVTCTNNSAKFQCMVFEIFKQSQRQTDRQTNGKKYIHTCCSQYFAYIPGAKQLRISHKIRQLCKWHYCITLTARFGIRGGGWLVKAGCWLVSWLSLICIYMCGIMGFIDGGKNTPGAGA